MDLLEHPMEAVAFRLYSLPIPEAASAATGAAAAWTCLAAVLAAAAAAAGLWRLRSSTTAAALTVSTKPLELDPSRTAEVSSAEPSSRPSSTQRSPEPAAVSSPKERYTAYFRDAGCCVGCCDAGSDEDNEEDADNDVEEDHEDGGGDRDVFVSSDGAADPFGWGQVVVRSPLRPLSLSPTTVSEMGPPRRYRRSPLGGGSVVQLWDQGGGGGGLTPTSSPRRRGRVVVGAAF